MADGAPHKILVVDDEADFERMVTQRMRREIRDKKYDFVFAGNGVEAVARLNEDPSIEMVLSDINMPEMDGLTLLQQIPKINPRIRAVIISAYGDMKNIRTAMNRGAFDFVTKPIDFDDLKVTVDRTLQHLAMMKDALVARDKLVVLENELDIARKMQQMILPTTFPETDKYQLYGGMKPARNVGGDFFDIVTLSDGRIGLAVADVSGKGVPAAMFMMSSRTLLKGASIGSDPRTDMVVGEVNKQLCDNNEAAMFTTLFFAALNASSGKLEFVNGGHNPPLLIHSDGSSTYMVDALGVALGVVPDRKYENHSIQLKPGDTVFMYTDGVTEAEDHKEKQFGVERLQKMFADEPPTGAQDVTDRVFKAVDEFGGDAEQYDDITCLTLYWKG
ncbi:MAG: SpoIIE family protein phosphatase [Parvularculales bacterium]